MPTAPSFKDFTRLTEPFDKNGKRYITVQNPKTGTKRDVRWYSDIEYAKNYGKQEKTDGFPNLKRVRGFEKGPILCVRNIRGPEDEAWLEKSIARYAVGIGWHFISTDIFPDDAPDHFKYIPLSWEEFRLGDDFHMKDPKDLAALINRRVAKKEFIDMKNAPLSSGRVIG